MTEPDPTPPHERRDLRAPKPTSERGWARAETLAPELTARLPAAISDGSGLSFSPAALTAPAPALDPEDPAVRTLIAQIDHSANGPQLRMPWRSETRGVDELGELLAGWRLLAATEDRRLFGKGVPPRLVTVGVRRERRRWTIEAVSPARQLRASRGGIRASSFRVDPDRPPSAQDTVLRLLVTEQTRAGGRLAHGRLQAPELFLSPEEILLRCYVTPLGGWQAGTRHWETPVLVSLPEPVGEREVVDGAIYFQGAPRR